MGKEDVSEMIPIMILFLLFTAVLCMISVVRGPSIYDRLIAADTIGVISAVIIILMGMWFEQPFLYDVALVYGVLLFADMLIFAKFLEKGDVIR